MTAAMWPASSSSGSMRRRSERLGLPLSPVLALRSRCAVAGTVLTARLALEHGIACNTAGGSHHAFAGLRVRILRVQRRRGRCPAAAGRGGDRQGAGHRPGRAPGRRHGRHPRPTIRACTRLSVHCRVDFPARKQQSDLDVALDAGVGDADYLGRPRPSAAAAPGSRAARPGLLQCRRRSARGRPAGPPGAHRRRAGGAGTAGARAVPEPRAAARLRRRRRLCRRPGCPAPAGTRCCTRRSRRCPTGSGLRPGRSCPGS